MRQTLSQRNFTLLWVAGLISLLGDRALRTALPFFIYEQTGSTLASSAMFTAFYLPMALLGSVSGVFVDRWDRKRIMVVTSLLQAATMLLLLLVRSDDSLWLAYLVVFIEVSLSTLFGPAEDALLPRLVSEDLLLPANALNALNNNLARLLGPPLGGIVIGLFGLGSVAVFDSISFLIAALLISLIRTPAAPTPPSAQAVAMTRSAWAGVWHEWRDGLRMMRQSRMIAAVFVIANVTSFGGTMFDPLIAPFVQDRLRAGADARGWLSTSGAVGGLVGGALLGQFGRGIRASHLFAFGAIVAGSLLLVMYNLTVLPAVLMLHLVLCIPLVGCGAGLTTLLQTSVTDEYRGRVYGALGTTNALLGLVSIWMAGILAGFFGIVPLLSLAAGITIMAGGLGLVLLPRAEDRHDGR